MPSSFHLNSLLHPHTFCTFTCSRGKFVCAATSPVERQGEFGHSLAFMVFELAGRVFSWMPLYVHGRRRWDAGAITAS